MLFTYTYISYILTCKFKHMRSYTSLINASEFSQIMLLLSKVPESYVPIPRPHSHPLSGAELGAGARSLLTTFRVNF